MVYGFGRIDASGRVADRSIIRALGWRGGDRLTLTADAGMMVARRDPRGTRSLGHLPRWHRFSAPTGREHIHLVPGLEQMAAEHPLDEHIHAQLMLALYRSGASPQPCGSRHRRR